MSRSRPQHRPKLPDDKGRKQSKNDRCDVEWLLHEVPVFVTSPRPGAAGLYMWSAGGLSNCPQGYHTLVRPQGCNWMMVRLIFVTWLLAETGAYVLFFTFFSMTVGFLVGLCSIFAGMMALKFGRRHFVKDAIRSLSSPSALSGWRSTPLGLLGAVLLLVPGFISDVIGLALVLSAAVAVWRRPSKTSDTRNVELSSDEWTRLPDDPPK